MKQHKTKPRPVRIPAKVRRAIHESVEAYIADWKRALYRELGVPLPGGER
ncbi:MAG TPA: hypothetical protein VK789_28205 [Bryobacteraceae bacterium]|nr:hypothetical protein [Bryobacteraceae bacterium]